MNDTNAFYFKKKHEEDFNKIREFYRICLGIKGLILEMLALKKILQR